MITLNFATTNPEKIQIAKTVCSTTDLTINPVSLEIDEIQGEDPELIVRDKAKRAFEQTGGPVVVTDDTWDIPALNGFPGAYMKSINYWFKAEDFLRLMHGIEDRRVILRQYLAYCDGKTTQVFSNELPGKMLNEARGASEKSPNMAVIVLDSDNGRSIAEVFEQGQEAVIARYKNRRDVWHVFVEWYTKSENANLQD